MSTDIAKQNSTDMAEWKQELPPEIVLELLFSGARVPPTVDELKLFIKVCQGKNLNPFLREAYLIKYDEKAPASIVIGKDAAIKSANSTPMFDGLAAGIIVQRKDKAEYLDGAFFLKGDVIVGGWAKVYRKDRSHPSTATVSLAEYGSNQSTWRSIPATMIRKVAVVQALREAFPEEMGGLYDSAEMQQALPDHVDLLKETGHVVEAIKPESVDIPADYGKPGSIQTSMVDHGVCPEHNGDDGNPIPFKEIRLGEMRIVHKVEKDSFGNEAKGPKGGAVWCFKEQTELGVCGLKHEYLCPIHGENIYGERVAPRPQQTTSEGSGVVDHTPEDLRQLNDDLFGASK